MTAVRELTRVPDPVFAEDPVEIAAHACHTAWRRQDLWNEVDASGRAKVSEAVKEKFRIEGRAIVAALQQAGFMRGGW